jgi:hypothetical protein
MALKSVNLSQPARIQIDDLSNADKCMAGNQFKSTSPTKLYQRNRDLSPIKAMHFRDLKNTEA